MRVCYVANHALGTDGWGRYTVELIKAIRPMGVEPVLVTASPDEVDPALADIEHYPILNPVFKGRFTTPRSFLKAPALRRILNTCEAVHCTVELYAPLVGLAAPRQLPYFQNAHGTWSIRTLENPRMRLFFAPAFRRANKIICLSRFTHQRMSRLMALPHAVVLTGGVTPELYQREVKMAFPEWTQGAKIAFTAGGIKTRKGQHITLEAIALAKRHLPDLHYALTGNDRSDMALRLKARAEALGIADCVHFLGMVSEDELVAWYQQADVFVLNSLNDGSSFEGLGLVYLEAGAAGTPSIGSLNCGAMDAIMDGESGLLVPQNDPQATAEALVNILSDSDLRARMGEGARRLAQHLTWNHLAGQIMALYKTALSIKE